MRKHALSLIISLTGLLAVACNFTPKAEPDRPINGARIEDGTIGATDLAAGAVASASLADDSITSAKITDATIATADLAANSVTSAKIANGTIVGADLDATTTLSVAGVTATGTVTAATFAYASAQTRTHFVDPSTCVLDSAGRTDSHDANILYSLSNFDDNGPGIKMRTNANFDSVTLYCPVRLPLTTGATVTITDHTANLYDAGTKCAIGAKLQSKTLGLGVAPTDAHAYICTGAEASPCVDFAEDGGGYSETATTIPLAFTNITVTSSKIVWVRVHINNIAGGGACAVGDFASGGDCDCRYLGSTVTYTTDRP